MLRLSRLFQAISHRLSSNWKIAAVVVLAIHVGSAVAQAQSVATGRWVALTVEPASGRIKPEQRDGSVVFVVPESPALVDWIFTYRVENPTRRNTMQSIILSDVLGPGLEVVEVSQSYAPGVAPGKVDLGYDTWNDRYSFRWHGFELKPGEWAQLTVKTGPGPTPAARGYASCNLYRLNSPAILRYTLDGGGEIYERQGNAYYAEIPCPPYLEVRFNTKVTWLLRGSGDYYGQAIKGKVAANHPVEITFSGFGDLKHANSDQTLPVYYALNEEQPQGWLTPEQLNATSLLLDGGGARTWSVWQRVVLDGQSAGTYTDTGVITFTLRNVHDALW